MPLFYQQNINDSTRLAIWKIEETAAFFADTVPLQREITHPHKRLQHLAGRYLLRFLFPDFPYDEILIADTRKPFLPGDQYHFSISHCGDYAAAIASRTFRVGIDVEAPSAKVGRVLQKFLHAEELESFNGDMLLENLPHATLLWSAKEAVYKWWGNGLVDFSEMIRLNTFSPQQYGTIDAVFKHPALQKELLLHYGLFQKLCLVYVCSEV